MAGREAPVVCHRLYQSFSRYPAQSPAIEGHSITEGDDSAAVDQILTSARRLKEASKVYDAGIKDALNRLIFNDSIDVNQLLQEPSPESILYEWLSPCGFNPLGD